MGYVCCLGMRASRPVHAVQGSRFVRASPFPHLQLRYFTYVFLKDHVLDNDDDHEPGLGVSRSCRWCMRIVDDERSRFGDFFLSMGGRMCGVHYW